MQYARPASDISNNGEWLKSSGSDAYALLNDESPNESTYIYTSSSPAGPTIRLGLSAVTDPGIHTGHAFLFSALNTDSNDSLTVSLYEGVTLIASKTQALTSSFDTYTYNLLEAEAALITDYAALEVEIVSAVGSFDVTQNCWFELQVPIAVIGSFTVVGTLEQAQARSYDYPWSNAPGRASEGQVITSSTIETSSKPMKAAKPVSTADAQAGRICSYTGLWYPGHRIVYVDGNPYGDDVAPAPETPTVWPFDF